MMYRPLDGRPKPCMQMLLEASRDCPRDLPPDMEFFQVSHTRLIMTVMPNLSHGPRKVWISEQQTSLTWP